MLKVSFLKKRAKRRVVNIDGAGHEWIRFLVGSGIYIVAPNFLNILQFFLCKSIEN